MEDLGSFKINNPSNSVKTVNSIYTSPQKNRKVKIYKSYEKILCGTAGTLINNYKFFDNSVGIMIHCDNFTNFNLKKLVEAHEERPLHCLLTMLTFNSSNPSNCGVVQVNSEKIVQNFFEKEQNPPSNIANGAVYVFENDFLNWLIENYQDATDFSTEILPNLMGKIYTYHTNLPYIDIGTIEALESARKLAKNSFK